MRYFTGAVAIFIFAALLAGCGGMLHRMSGTVDMPHITKRVADKQEPYWLIAYDRSTCRVSEETFRTVRINDSVRCAWSTPPQRTGGIVATNRSGTPSVHADPQPVGTAGRIVGAVRERGSAGGH